MNKTQIEWVKNPDGTQGYTWNPITGCLNGCEYCYARKLANTRLFKLYMGNSNVAPHRLAGVEAVDVLDPFYPRFWEDRLIEPVNKLRRWGKNRSVFNAQSPKGIFVCDMSDLFGIGIPEEWTRRVLDKLQYAKQHRFYLLTKQPQNLIKFSPFPDNAWVGVSVTNELQYVEAYGYLKDVESRVKFYSFEPLLERVRVSSIGLDRRVQWVIIGAQTKPNVYPKIEWVSEIVEACDKAGIPVFLKNNLRSLYAKANNAHHDMVRLRQEMPE